MKKIVICADDFGYSKEINDAIIKLGKNSKITAISCLTNTELWPIASHEIKTFYPNIQIGIHLCLTELNSLSETSSISKNKKLPSFGKIFIKSILGQINKEEIKIEFKEQILRFYSEMGFWPQFIDSHQHIHQIPQLSWVLKGLLAEIPELKNSPIRNSSQGKIFALGMMTSIKRLILHLMGIHFKMKCLKWGIKTNNNLCGIYSYRERIIDSKTIKKMMDEANDNDIFIHHPSLKKTIKKKNYFQMNQEIEYLLLSE
ncbi:MAG: ChbG/HpnK family deacetylase, partial [Bdellovibrionales bacterium]|nr:ChbG/HpnK family deacetylase [Bdellovibrionales bacterium]